MGGIDDGRPNRLRASYQQVPAGHLSPKFSENPTKHHTPNPLVKYSYISPTQSTKEDGCYVDSSVIPAFATLSNKRSVKSNKISGPRGLSINSGKTTTHKIDIRQFSDQVELAPKIKGIKKQEIL